MADLKCFRVTDHNGDSVWTVTDDPEKARAIARESFWREEGDPDEAITVVPDDETMTIYDEETGETTTATIREMVEAYQPEWTGLLSQDFGD
jgi:hypothetical protein